MSDLTKNEAIIEALESAGYQDIRLKVVPKRFLFSDGRFQTELEFSRNYFDDTTLATLQGLMKDTSALLCAVLAASLGASSAAHETQSS